MSIVEVVWTSPLLVTEGSSFPRVIPMLRIMDDNAFLERTSGREVDDELANEIGTAILKSWRAKTVKSKKHMDSYNKELEAIKQSSNGEITKRDQLELMARYGMAMPEGIAALVNAIEETGEITRIEMDVTNDIPKNDVDRERSEKSDSQLKVNANDFLNSEVLSEHKGMTGLIEIFSQKAMEEGEFVDADHLMATYASVRMLHGAKSKSTQELRKMLEDPSKARLNTTRCALMEWLDSWFPSFRDFYVYMNKMGDSELEIMKIVFARTMALVCILTECLTNIQEGIDKRLDTKTLMDIIRASMLRFSGLEVGGKDGYPWNAQGIRRWFIPTGDRIEKMKSEGWAEASNYEIDRTGIVVKVMEKNGQQVDIITVSSLGRFYPETLFASKEDESDDTEPEVSFENVHPEGEGLSEALGQSKDVIIHVNHKDLERLGEDEKYRSYCPLCHGVLVAQRDGSGQIMRHDRCSDCNQAFCYDDLEYLDEPISEEVPEDMREGRGKECEDCDAQQ